MRQARDEVIGIVLAGGRGQRLGSGEKCLRQLGAHSLLQRAVARAAPQASRLLLSFNGSPALLPPLGLPVLADTLPGFAGPLAGVLAGLEHLRTQEPGARWLASFACDCPWFPRDLVARLHAATAEPGCELAVARCAGRLQPVFALWSCTLAQRLRAALEGEGLRKAGQFALSLHHVTVDWPAATPDPFFNINTPADLAAAAAMLQEAELA